MSHAIRRFVMTSHSFCAGGFISIRSAAASAKVALRRPLLAKRIMSLMSQAIRGSLDATISARAACWSPPPVRLRETVDEGRLNGRPQRGRVRAIRNRRWLAEFLDDVTRKRAFSLRAEAIGPEQRQRDKRCEKPVR